jgi:hypothetical protein
VKEKLLESGPSSWTPQSLGLDQSKAKKRLSGFQDIAATAFRRARQINIELTKKHEEEETRKQACIGEEEERRKIRFRPAARLMGEYLGLSKLHRAAAAEGCCSDAAEFLALRNDAKNRWHTLKGEENTRRRVFVRQESERRWAYKREREELQAQSQASVTAYRDASAKVRILREELKHSRSANIRPNVEHGQLIDTATTFPSQKKMRS